MICLMLGFVSLGVLQHGHVLDVPCSGTVKGVEESLAASADANARGWSTPFQGVRMTTPVVIGDFETCYAAAGAWCRPNRDRRRLDAHHIRNTKLHAKAGILADGRKNLSKNQLPRSE